MTAYLAEPDAGAAPADLPTLAQSRRRAAVRTALHAERHLGTRWTEACRPALDQSVNAARRYHESSEHNGAVVPAQALADRAGLAATSGRYEAALEDLIEAAHLRSG